LRASAKADDSAWIESFQHEIERSAQHARTRREAIVAIAAMAERLAQMDFSILYDADRHLFSIGYNATERRLDSSFYDLLASEARLASYFAIAFGQVSQENWYALGRLLAQTSSGPVLVSWSGSMFEYLMPVLVAPSYRGSLLDESCRGCVQQQIAYGRESGIPWGISESGYNLFDAALNYQYRAFGVPGLGLKRGLAEDIVVAPYATALALTMAPRQAARNLARLAADGMLGSCGFYEARDYTLVRMRRGETSAIVQSFMAHHQGMSLLAFAHVLFDAPTQRRFCAVPQFRAALNLLQERIPRVGVIARGRTEMVDVRAPGEAVETPIRVYETGATPTPAVQLLSNGRYHLMLTNAGGGYSRWRDLAVTRWREDTTCDPWGLFCFVRDVGLDRNWSATWQPVLSTPDFYEAIFTESRVEFRRQDGDIGTHTDIAVSPEDDIELRRIRLINRARTRKTIEFTSCGEVVIAPPPADAAQRGFGNLFVQTSIVAERDAIVCTRRPRSKSERPPWMLHLVKVRGGSGTMTTFETDRARFLGRGNNLARASAIAADGPLSGASGAVLDPLVAIRHRVVLEPEQTLTIDVVTGVTEDRETCYALIDKYQDRTLADRVFDLAWTHSQVALRQINVTEADAQLYGRIAGRIIYANASLRADAALIASNRRNQTGLWGYAISGDLPILLLKVRDSNSIALARQLVQAHAYWRMKGVMVDLVIWNDDRGGYRQLLQEQIMGLIAAHIEGNIIDRPGGIFVRPVDQVSPDDRILLQAAARVVIADDRGALIDQVRRRDSREASVPAFTGARGEAPGVETAAEITRPLLMLNGSGGFSADGSEYVITTNAKQRTPLPWVNIIANPDFGTVVSESGAGYTWAENAHEFRLTPWHDDPVSDPAGEAFYLRDEETGEYWSPAPAPACGTGDYATRHGFGYSIFEHIQNGIRSELWVYVDLHHPVKYCVLKIRNLTTVPRRLSATGYIEWVLGDTRAKSGPHIVSEMDSNSGALLARNAFHPEFPGRVAFFDVDDPRRTVTCDRSEFIGRNGDLARPRALGRAHLSGRVGAALDPCAAIQVPFELGEGRTREIIFRIGASRNQEDASALVLRCRDPGTARDALVGVGEHWQRMLGVVRLTTPDPGMNLLANGWLVYQVIASRIWGRSGYYQSGGAWGFRDQLQDTMALVHCAPQMLRAQLLLSASRQFLQGDVQHWWHPPTGRGVRTRCSDDYLWLPHAACRYVETTGDSAILREQVAFLDGRELGPHEESYYDLPARANAQATLYEHCRRAIRHGLRFGPHGLPLIGSGDWNDGMNNVGIEGRGESVWLAFFLYDVLTRFAALATGQDDAEFAAQCGAQARELQAHIEAHAWDGEWYLRAWFDDGTPLGSAANQECRIDSIAQSWAELSGCAEDARRVRALESLSTHLVRRDEGLIQLLAPPFDHSELDPGYIKGYVPGVRENGGQYTHAAVWAATAFAERGDAARAYELFGLINPLNHADSAAKAAVYKVEPYVLAADVYGVDPHVGRGGWTWYTGSAGWLYRLIVESIVGVRLERGCLTFKPCAPDSWRSYEVVYCFGSTRYDIEFRREGGEAIRVSLDGHEVAGAAIELTDDGGSHRVQVRIAGGSVALPSGES
jgi:cellobiose phosphorylase